MPPPGTEEERGVYPHQCETGTRKRSSTDAGSRPRRDRTPSLAARPVSTTGRRACQPAFP